MRTDPATRRPGLRRSRPCVSPRASARRAQARATGEEGKDRGQKRSTEPRGAHPGQEKPGHGKSSPASFRRSALGTETLTDCAAAAGNQLLKWTAQKATSPYRRRPPPGTTTPRSLRPRTAECVAARPLSFPEEAKEFSARMRLRGRSRPLGTIFPRMLRGSCKVDTYLGGRVGSLHLIHPLAVAARK